MTRTLVRLLVASSVFLVAACASGPPLSERGKAIAADGRAFLDRLSSVAPLGEPRVAQDASEDVACEGGARRVFEAEAPIPDDSLEQDSYVALVVASLEGIGYDARALPENFRAASIPATHEDSGAMMTVEVEDMQTVRVTAETECV